MVENDVELIHRILSGDDGAFRVLLEKHQKRVHALIWRKIGDFHIAEEITQDTFLQVYKKLSTLKDPHLFDGWLYVIANRLCLNWIQRNRPKIRLQSLEEITVEDIENYSYTSYESEQRETANAEHRRETVKKLLAKLPESERTVMTLYYLGGMTAKEIGKFLGVSVNTIKSRLHRARERLQSEEELLITETLGGLKLSNNLIENVMKQIADMKPDPVPAGKPLLPWVAFGTAAVLVIVLLGAGSQYLARFQKPYNVRAQSETTVEIIDASVVIDTQAKPDLRNQMGRFNTIGKSKSAGQQPSGAVMLAAAQVEKETRPPTKQQWVRAGGPSESISVSGLWVSSWGDVYAASKIGIYKLVPDATAWTLTSSLPPEASVDNHGIQMTERNGKLYLVFPNGVFASEDRGETWVKLGARPEGPVRGLVVTDDALYLALQDEGVFRSTDAGKQWTSLNAEIAESSTRAIAAVGNTVFIGTNRGLYRWHLERLAKLPITTKAIHSLSVSGNRLYIGTGRDDSQLKTAEGRQAQLEEIIKNMDSDGRKWEVFYSTDLGDSWVDITPTSKSHMMKIASGVKVVAFGESILTLGLISFHSADGGKTWTELSSDSMTILSWIPAVAVDENTFLRVGAPGPGLTRSTDGGESWHPFMNGMVGISISNLVRFKNALYTSTVKGIAKSSDGGESWQDIPANPGEVTLKPAEAVNPLLIFPKLAIADSVLYGADGTVVPEHGLRIYRLSANGNVFVLMQGIPKLEGAPSITDIMDRTEKADKLFQLESFPSAFAVSGETFYVEYMRQLLRWKRGDSEWFSTGLTDTDESAHDNGDAPKELKLAVSGETLYAGKRDGSLFQSLDSGNRWEDVTSNLPLDFKHFKAITFAGSTVYVGTDAGVLRSEDGKRWHAITDTAGTRTIIDQIAVDNVTVYGASDESVYRLKNRNEWEKITPEVPGSVTALVVNGGRLYITTKHSGLFHVSIAQE